MSVSASACPRNQIPADTEVFRAFGSLKTRSLFHFGNHENLKFGSSTAAGGGNGARDWHPRKWRTSVGRRMAIDLECHPRVPSIVGTSSSGMAADAVSVTRTRNSMMSGDHQTHANPARNTANIGPLSGATNCILIGKHRHINHGQCYQRKHRAAVPHDRRARTHKRFGEPVATPVPPNIFTSSHRGNPGAQSALSMIRIRQSRAPSDTPVLDRGWALQSPASWPSQTP